MPLNEQNPRRGTGGTENGWSADSQGKPQVEGLASGTRVVSSPTQANSHDQLEVEASGARVVLS